MNTKYNPSEIEDKIYKEWENGGYFTPEIDKEKEPFTIVMPPQNVTGKLHMGHALDQTIQDVFTRYNRMKGKPTLWLPGTDHASIATEVKVVEKLEKEGITKESLGREGFLKEAWKWKEQYGNNITMQVRRLGCSCDWTRERFTMDEGLNDAVMHVFVELYKKGLIYKGERIVNWCTKCKTSISDNEVEYAEEASNLWHIRYQVEGTDEYVTVATTRPETMLGDTAVAVNPDDERYKSIVGKNLILPIINKKIPLIADEYVEKDFGTGAVKITPAHDPNDYEVGKRHNLEIISVIGEDGLIVDGYGKYSKMDRVEARKQIVEDLKALGNLVKIEEYTHNVGKCYRCHTTIEPYASKQWFVAMKDLAAPAIEAVKKGECNFIPERFTKIYMNWMENIRDWCISRQLWWGHRIPAYYCDKCGKMEVSIKPLVDCACGGKYVQDEDVLDTWFSSALWPFSTLGWPNKTEDFEYFYPTTMLVTGYDIITFWVSKMIFSAIEHTGKVPFKDVYIHGLVRDAQGRKMSKSLGNGVDPIEIMDTYGTDALRFSLIQNNAPGNDIRFIPEKVEAGRNFANKLWNAARFVLGYLDKAKEQGKILPDIFANTENLKPEDKWILSKLSDVTQNVTTNIDNFEIGVALNTIYDYTWSDFCGSYIEMVKPRLYDEESPEHFVAISVLKYTLGNILKLLHPYMPYITEEIYSYLDENTKLIVANWPETKFEFKEEEKFIENINLVIKEIRNIRATSNIPNSQKLDLYMYSENYDLNSVVDILMKMCQLKNITILNSNQFENNGTVIHTEKIDCVLDTESAIDKEKEKEKLLQDREVALKELKRAEGMLSNEKFVAKAPVALIEQEKEKVKKYIEIISKIDESLK